MRKLLMTRTVQKKVVLLFVIFSAALFSVAIFSTGIISPAYSQELPVIHYGIKEGLPSVYITSLTQGEDGRLWIAHRAGFSVYDGSGFKNWSKKDGLLGSMPDSLIMDNRGVLWMTFSNTGLQYMERDGLIHTVPDPYHIFQDDLIPFLYRIKDDSILAAGKKGYYKISKEKIEGPFYPLENENGRINYILDLGENRGILLATKDGVFNIKGQSKKLLPLPYEKIATKVISVMTVGSQGEVWFVSTSGWLLRWKNEEYQIWDLKTQTNSQTIAIFEIQMDPLGNLWIATGDGPFLWKDGIIEKFTEAEGLSNKWINSLLIDREGILWLGTESGLDKISRMSFRNYRYRRDLPVNAVWAIEELADGSIWIGTNCGIVVIDSQGKSRIISRKEGLPERSIVDLKATKDGKVWILSYSGVHLWDGKKFISFPYKPLAIIDLWGILPVNENEIWIYTLKGIFVLDPERKTFYEHPLNDKIEDSAALENLILRKNGDVFTVGRKIYLVKKEGTLEEIKLPEWGEKISIFNLVEEEDKIWLVTNEGLISYDWKTWKRYPVKEKKIFNMVIIREGEFWLGCSSGIGRFDGENYHFFGAHDGIAVEECNSGSALLDKKGRVWLGGKNVTLIYPSLIRKHPPCKPLITRAVVDENTYSLPEKLEFPSRVKSVEFYFSSPSFFNEQEQVFRYRMKGLEIDWSASTKEHSVRYTNLPPGNYPFEVQSRQKHGDWDGPVAYLEVKVLPTFWQTTLAKILMVLLFIIVGFLIGMVRVLHFKSQQKKLQRLVDEQIAEIKKQRDKVSQLATTDELTGISNRRKFIENMDTEMVRSKRYKRALSLLIIDIDNFKDINDSYGHSVGDEILKVTASRGLHIIRKTDTLARWGGDEFVLLMSETDKDKAVEICERLKASIQSSPLNLSATEFIEFTISGGISTWDINQEGDKKHDDIFKEADLALYRAKESGRNKICHY